MNRINKISVAIAIYLLVCSSAMGQPGNQNFDKTWIQGEVVTFQTRFGSSGGKPVNTTLHDTDNTDLYFAVGNSSICDSNGDPLLLCNGYNLFDKNLDIIDGGNDLAPHRFVKFNNGFSFYSQTSIILPFDSGIYRLITPVASDFMCVTAWESVSPTGAVMDLLLYDEVDMKANGGAGKVTKRMLSLLEDVRLAKVGMMACRHGDGKSWWLLKQDVDSNLLYKFLLTKDTIYGPYLQGFTGEAGNIVGRQDQLGQLKFSRDGTKFASTFIGGKKVFTADFDRCSGMLSNPKVYRIPDDFHGTGFPNDEIDSMMGGLEFSPNGKYLYVCGYYEIAQIALNEPNAAKRWTYLSGPDTTLDQFARYENMSIGPDGKIYIGNRDFFSGQMSVINAPDNYGMAAGFCRKCLRFPPTYSLYDSQYHYYCVSTPPCMPNYRLGAVSPTCKAGPISVKAVTAEAEFSLYPNPSRGIIEVKYKEQGNLYLYDMTGRVVGHYRLQTSTANKLSISLYDLPTGVYQYRYIAGNGSSKSGKLVIEE